MADAERPPRSWPSAGVAAEAERDARAVQAAGDAVFDWDLVADELYLSARFNALLGLTAEPTRAAPAEWLDRVHPDERGPLRQALDAHLAETLQRFRAEHRLRTGDGTYRWVLARGRAVRDAEGRAARLSGLVTDISAYKEAEARLQHDALHDPLTGLPNRALFLDRLTLALRRARRAPDGALSAVLFLDLDGFKPVNDSLGHLVGDRLLVTAAARLQGALRPGDTVARLGGDEFTVLLETMHDVEEATAVAERIQQALADPFRLDGRALSVSASVGIATANPSDEPDDVLRNADLAMYEAKRQGRARHVIFDPALHRQARARLDLESALRDALDQGSLVLHYQPVIALDTGELAGVEALCRWPGGAEWHLAPRELVVIAQEAGLITRLGRWVREEACRQLADWGRELTMSVNVAPQELAAPELADELRALLRETGIAPEALRLEVAEHALGESADTVLRTLVHLRDAVGVRARLDDFGGGAGTLRALPRFPGDAIKLDGELVREVGESGAVIRAIVSLAHELGLRVVAEGVETPEQLAALRALGCDYAQGFAVAPPLTPQEVTARLG